MEYVELGTTGQKVSAVALGCMSLTHEMEAQSRATVIRAFELGINFYDTADVYSRGESEEVLGAALKEGRIARDQVGITYLKKSFGIDGIISTHTNIIQYAKKQELIALQRLFIVDSESVNTGARLVQSSKPDSVEILPGIILPYIQPELDKLRLPPIVAGGLIKTRDDIDRILASGAVAVSTSRRELW